jgi:hypothetical protein
MPQRRRSELPWSDLAPELQRTLRWLHAVRLLHAEDLAALAWPDRILKRQSKDWALDSWSQDTFIAPGADKTWYRLGPLGAVRLREAGVDTAEPADWPAERAQQGIQSASRFAVSLALDIRATPGVIDFSWQSDPFSGEGVRADGSGALHYHINPQSVPLTTDPNELLWLHPAKRPVAGQALDWLLLEVDSGTESGPQLARRCAAWGEELRRQYAAAPPGCWPTVLWVVTGGAERMQSIWRAWLTEAACPLLITSRAELMVTGTLHPWHALWRDEHGRPRSLNPYAGQEPIWRYEPSPPPVHTRLDQAIRAWE